jgi:hypothetical protein
LWRFYQEGELAARKEGDDKGPSRVIELPLREKKVTRTVFKIEVAGSGAGGVDDAILLG